MLQCKKVVETQKKISLDFFYFADSLLLFISGAFFSSFFFLNRLHSCLCPPGLQCARWHSLLQYCTVRQPEHFRKVCPLGCGVLHDEQQTGEGDVGVDVEEGITGWEVHEVDSLPSSPSFSFGATGNTPA